MKKQSKMICLAVAFLALLNGCKKSETLQSGANVITKKNSNLFAGDEKWDLLGFGLDVTADLLDEKNSISDVSIFDMKKFEQDFLDRIDAKINISYTSDGGGQYYGGASALDYTIDIHNKTSFDSNGNVTVAGAEKAAPTGTGTGTGTGTSTGADKNLTFTGSFVKNTSDQNIKTYSSKYSYATYELYRNVKKLRFTGDVSTALLMNYLTPEFKANVASHTADDLVKRYGTHVLLDITKGGRLRFTYSGIVKNETDMQKRTSDVKIGFGANILKIVGINITAGKTKEEMTQVAMETRERNYTGRYYGGSNSGESLALDKDGNTSQAVNIAGWQQSIDAKNAALVSVGKAAFLYDFIADPVKKASVKVAVEKYIKEHQIAEIGEVPVYSYFSQRYGDHYFMTVNQPSTGDGSYLNEGPVFYAFSKATTGAVPIYIYNSQKYGDHYLTPENSPSIGDGSYKNEGIAFYAFTKPTTGAVPVYVYNSQRYGDHVYVTQNSPSLADGSYVNEGIAFYAYK